MAAMVSRPEWAGVLLEAIRKGTIPRGELSAFHARQVAGFNDEGLSGLLYETWGQVRKSPAEKEAAMKKWTALLTPARLAGADLVSGEAAFQRACAACHVLFGRGGKLGPELTGTDRRNTFYLLENILDPGAVVPIDYRVMILEKKDGTVLAGSLVEQNEQVVTLQTTTERVTVPRRKIKRLERGLVSTMPEGLLQVFSEQEVVDLVAFLQQ
jgi:putative heme-binding domain-containing protein